MTSNGGMLKKIPQDYLEGDRISLSKKELQEVLPHGDRFMFLDSVEILKRGIEASAIMQDFADENFSYLQDHFPHYQIIPGVIITESLALLLGIAAVSSDPEYMYKIGMLVQTKTKHRRPIKPSDQVSLYARVKKARSGFIIGEVSASVNGETAVTGELKLVIQDIRTPEI